LDGFLRLVSLATRIRCVCTSWTYSDDRSSFVSHYYQNKTLPKGRVPSINETLIDVACFQKFIRKAYRKYVGFTERELFDTTIYALVNERSTLEDRFARTFSGLQSVLWFAFRSNGGIGTRIPIKKLFELFTARYTVDLKDLWPLFVGSAGASLYDIRNAIAHGEFISSSMASVLSYAQENLAWTVERMLLAVLDWPVDDSKVSHKYLSGWSVAHNWVAVRAQW
jgi:hypothetical protein